MAIQLAWHAVQGEVNWVQRGLTNRREPSPLLVTGGRHSAIFGEY
jgi:hypothetical protein